MPGTLAAWKALARTFSNGGSGKKNGSWCHKPAKRNHIKKENVNKPFDWLTLSMMLCPDTIASNSKPVLHDFSINHNRLQWHHTKPSLIFLQGRALCWKQIQCNSSAAKARTWIQFLLIVWSAQKQVKELAHSCEIESLVSQKYDAVHPSTVKPCHLQSLNVCIYRDKNFH